MAVTATVPCKDHGRKGMPYGYTTGRITLPDGTVHKTTLHRAVFYEAHGYLPEVVRHTCDNGRCIEITHLVPGTQKDNVRDMYERGRAVQYDRRGERNSRAVLTDEQCAAIRSRYRKNCRINGLPALAREFGVGTSQVWRIVKGVQRA